MLWDLGDSLDEVEGDSRFLSGSAASEGRIVSIEELELVEIFLPGCSEVALFFVFPGFIILFFLLLLSVGLSSERRCFLETFSPSEFPAPVKVFSCES